MIYAWRYPQSIHRSVMVAANPPGNYLWNAKTTDEQIHRYAVAVRPGPGLPQPDARPRRVDPLRLREDPEPLLVPADQEGQRPHRRLLRPHQRDRRRRRPARGSEDDRHAPLDRQGQRGRRRVAALRSSPERRSRTRQVWGDVASVARIDAAYGRRLFASGADRGSVIGNPGTEFLWSGGRLLNAWPANPDEKEYNSVRNSNVRTLLINGQLDFAAPPAERDSPAPASPPERAPGRPAEARPRRRLLGLRARRVHPPDRQLPRQRPRRHLPLHDQPARLHAVEHPGQNRRDRRRRLPRLRRPRSSSPFSGSPGGFAAARRSDRRRASPCGRCSRCCSASAAGAWAC